MKKRASQSGIEIWEIKKRICKGIWGPEKLMAKDMGRTKIAQERADTNAGAHKCAQDIGSATHVMDGHKCNHVDTSRGGDWLVERDALETALALRRSAISAHESWGPLTSPTISSEPFDSSCTPSMAINCPVLYV